MNRKITVGCLIIALAPVFSLTQMLKDRGDLTFFSSSILSVLAYVAVFFTLRKAWERLNRRLSVIAGVLGFLFSTFMVAGINLRLCFAARLPVPETWLKIAGLFPLFFALTALLLEGIPKVSDALRLQRADAFLDRKLSAGRTFFLCWLLIFLAWLPGLIASYPGVYSYDAIYQLEYYTSGNISLHHPLIHTYLLGFCVSTLGKLFGSYEIGMLFYSIFQMLCLSAAFAAVSAYLHRRGIAAVIRIAFLLLFMFFPVNAIMSFSSTKDVLFAALIALLALLFARLAEAPALLKKNSFCVLTVAVSFFMMVFRNQGIYIFVLSMLAAFFLFKKYWKRVLVIAAAGIVLFALYSGPVTILLGGVKSHNVREMMSVPCVQLSRAMLDSADELSDDEKALIEKYIPKYKSYYANCGIADTMKNNFDEESFRRDPAEFIGLWLKVGCKCPIVYSDAFGRLTIGLWYPDMDYNDSRAFHPYWAYDCLTRKDTADKPGIYVERRVPSGMQWLNDFYHKLTYDSSYREIPVLSVLFSSGFTVWIMLLYIAWSVYSRRYRYLLPAAVTGVLWLTQLLGPVVLLRYIYPVMMCVPIFIGSALTADREKEK